MGAAVSIDGRNPDEACDFTPIEAPELRQFGDEGAQSRVAYSRRAGQKVGVGLPGWALADRAIDVPIEIGKLGLQEIDMPVDGLEHARLARETTAVFLRHDHLDELRPARRQFAERLGFAVGHAPRGRAYGLGEIGDRRGVKAVGLGALAGRAGEVSRI